MAALREAGLAGAIGVAPGPANGFTLDLIDCLERFGDRIDWAMVILNPLEPWPGELVPRRRRRAHGVKVITRVVDYGGLFWGDLRPGMELPKGDHRAFRPEGWIEAGLEKLDRLRPFAERAGLTPMQLACQWNLAHPAVECVVPTLIQEAGRRAPPDRGQARRAGRAPAPSIGSAPRTSTRSARSATTPVRMALKGANPPHEGEERPDRWPLSDDLPRSAGAGASTRATATCATPPDRLSAVASAACGGELVDAGRHLLRPLPADARLDRRRAGAAAASAPTSAPAPSSLQWVMNVYLLAITVFVVTAGRLGDMFGRKRVFLLGIGALRPRLGRLRRRRRRARR